MILHNDVGVGLKDRDNLLRGGHRFPMEDPPLGLIDHHAGKLAIGLQLFSDLLCQEYLSGICGRVSGKERHCPLRIGKALTGNVQKIETVPL